MDVHIDLLYYYKVSFQTIATQRPTITGQNIFGGPVGVPANYLGMGRGKHLS